MISEHKKWMDYTYFHRNPEFHWKTTHLYSLTKTKIFGMICVPFPTMVTAIRPADFMQSWSRSTKYKINRTENDGLEIKRGREILPDILQLFKETARLRKLRGYYPEDFDSRPWIICSGVYSGNKILAGHVWIVDQEEKRSLLYVNASGHHDLENDSSLTGRAHYYLLWQDGIYLRDQGIDFLDLNGYESKSKDPHLAGVYAWKEGTHGQEEVVFNYYPFWFIHLKNLFKKISG